MAQELIETIMRRRSIRKFTGESVSRVQLELILRAAMAAPSARNEKPWQFLVVTEKELIEKVCIAHPHAKFGTNAGAVIIPFGKKDVHDYFDQDMAASTENLLLMVSGLGLGATWCGMNAERQNPVRQAINLPESMWAFAVIPIGVPAEEKEPRTQFESSRVHWDTYAVGE